MPPIWNNKHLQELVPMEKINEWEEFDIGRLDGNYTLKTFAELREYGIPNHTFYRYLQIRHALNAQFKIQAVEWSRAPLLQRVVKSGMTKGLILDLYAQISSKIITGVRPAKNKRRWEEDLGVIITTEQWRKILEQVSSVSVSPSQ